MKKSIQKNQTEIDPEFLNHLLNLEKEWRNTLPRFSYREFVGIFLEAKDIVSKQIKKLEKQVKILKSEICGDLLEIYKQVEDEFSVWFFEKTVEIFKGEELEELERKIKKLKWVVRPMEKNARNRITEEMIQLARDYPFENLIQFNRAKKALCMFHNEKHPSLSLNPKTNRIKCFGCGINYDSIEYIIKTQGFSFVEAVKYLNHY